MSTYVAPDRSYAFRGSEHALIGRPIPAVISEIASQYPDNEALVSLHQGRRLLYRELVEKVDDLARGLMALGVEKGDRVGVWAVNCEEWFLLQVATARIGAILVNVNPAYRTWELKHALDKARVQTLFVMPAFKKSHYVEIVLEVIGEARDHESAELKVAALPSLKNLVVFDPDRDEPADRPAPAFMTWHDVLDLKEQVEPEALEKRTKLLDLDDPINIQFTSGTTGFSKPVVLTHRNILNNGYFCGRAMKLTDQDRLCLPVPFFHCFGMVIGNLACLSHGATVVLPSSHFIAEAALEAVEKEGCTVLHGVPTMFVAELEVDDFERFDLSSLRTGVMAGAPCPPELMRKVIGKLHMPEILIAYGQTEASPATHITAASDSFERRVETVGTNLPHQECKVVDPASGATVAHGVQGELCFRGYHVMRGYFEQPEATREVIDEADWLHSGDLGVMDADGYVKITGRLKDMIIRGGENVYPAEIEAFYFAHPKIAQVAVFGIPDERFGEEVVAWVQLKEGEAASGEELRLWAKGQLAHYKIPRYVEVVDDFPMTVTGKIQKFKMRELMAERIAKSTSA